MKRLRLPKDHFVIPLDKDYLYYVPLKGLLYLVNAHALDQLCRAFDVADAQVPSPISDVLADIHAPAKRPSNHSLREEPFPWNRLILDLSTECTLACVYCYAGAGDSSPRFMTVDCASSAIDLCVSQILTLPASRQHDRYLRLIFHGGSEPTTDWNLFVDVIEYANEACKQHAIPIAISMGSNGYYSDDKAQWIAHNLTNVSLSLDGYEEIQNTHRPTRNGRPSFDVVCRSAEIFMTSQSNTFRFGLRPTITEYSVAFLPEIISFFQQRFPGIGIAVEPAEEYGRCKYSNFRAPNPYVFVKKFIEASEMWPGTRLTYSGFIGIATLRERFCGASEPQFAVLPSGSVTACYGYSLKELFLKEFIYGQYDATTRSFRFDESRRSWLRRLHKMRRHKCSKCFARYQCGGDCPAMQMSQAKHGVVFSQGNRCVINRELAKWYLLKEVKSHEVKTGIAVT
jgi:uncharacterized protein